MSGTFLILQKKSNQTSSFSSLWQKNTLNATAKGKVEKIGLYAKDMFNFAGANNLYLFWSYKDKDFSTNGIAGTLDDNYHWLTNEDFNLFRKNTNNGEDFLIFSEVEKQSLSAKIHNK